MACFTHTVCSKANRVKFAHQLLCSPCPSTLLKAIRHGFLKGCPNLTSAGVIRYLNPSPALAKGHMKWPHQGIQRTHPKPPQTPPTILQPAPQLTVPVLPLFSKYCTVPRSRIWCTNWALSHQQCLGVIKLAWQVGPTIACQQDCPQQIIHRRNHFLLWRICWQAHRYGLQQTNQKLPFHVPGGERLFPRSKPLEVKHHPWSASCEHGRGQYLPAYKKMIILRRDTRSIWTKWTIRPADK